MLAGLKIKFNLVLCVNYHQSKLVPYWGMSAQPGCTYFLQKLGPWCIWHCHGSGKSAVYLCNETVGPKNTNHMLELVQQGKLDFVWVSFLIAGNTKFSPDQLFSKISHTYNCSDAFTTKELQEIISIYTSAEIDEGTIVCDWRSVLTKYSKPPGIRSMRDFIFTMNSVTGKVVTKVRPHCFGGRFENAPIHVLRGREVEKNAISDKDNENCVALGKLKQLSDSKLKHLKHDFIPMDRYLPYITPLNNN